jgi:hypothetical protein
VGSPVWMGVCECECVCAMLTLPPPIGCLAGLGHYDCVTRSKRDVVGVGRDVGVRRTHADARRVAGRGLHRHLGLKGERVGVKRGLLLCLHDGRRISLVADDTFWREILEVSEVPWGHSTSGWLRCCARTQGGRGVRVGGVTRCVSRVWAVCACVCVCVCACV